MDPKLRGLTGCTAADIVQLYVDALAAGTFCIDGAGHIEHASTSFATLFNKTTSDLYGTNLFDLLDAATEFNGILSKISLYQPDTATEDSGTKYRTIQQTVTIKNTQRQLLILGILKKVSESCLLMPESTSEIIPEVCANQVSRFCAFFER
ncbi:unnamed protein product [Gongylonema pulchrum]|uniref:PAS domain-containing protein n=1 Tax=Gongylonema pulchrum TaxID=637853 RepID=A0A183D851_9BILA|nr:unnamed protein product [Gongylonema pulchrum]